MIETLDSKERKARKTHICDYCGEEIAKGEVYNWSKHVFDGELYEWKCHKKCSFIASELWDYIDPDDGMTDDGMTEDDFYYGCNNFCRTFVCPDCEHWDTEMPDCENDKSFCTDKIYQFLQTHELYRAGRSMWAELWKCRKRAEQGGEQT